MAAKKKEEAVLEETATEEVEVAPIDAKKAAKEAKKAAKAEAKAKKHQVEPEKPKVTEARCIVRNIRTTPRKVRLVADLVRGKDVSLALGILANTNKSAVTPVAKAITSAAANATNNFGMDKNRLYIAEIQVGDGLRMKRYLPRAKGSASSLVKRNSNLLVVVKERA